MCAGFCSVWCPVCMGASSVAYPFHRGHDVVVGERDHITQSLRRCTSRLQFHHCTSRLQFHHDRPQSCYFRFNQHHLNHHHHHRNHHHHFTTVATTTSNYEHPATVVTAAAARDQQSAVGGPRLGGPGPLPGSMRLRALATHTAEHTYLHPCLW